MTVEGEAASTGTPSLVLASASPRRADVLRQLGLDVQVSPADVEESYLPGESPTEHVERLARDKATAVAERLSIDHTQVDQGPVTLVIGGDTVVVDGDVVLGKPSGPRAAVEMLSRLAGGEHVVLSGIAIAGAHGVVSDVCRTTVRMRPFDPASIEAYVATGEPLDKAGSYGIQGLGAALVEAIDGDYYSVVGFPVPTFVRLLERAGWRFLFGALTRIGDP